MFLKYLLGIFSGSGKKGEEKGMRLDISTDTKCLLNWGLQSLVNKVHPSIILTHAKMQKSE